MSNFSVNLEKIMEERNFFINGQINYSKTGDFQRFSNAGKPYKRSKDLFVILHDYEKGASFGDFHYPDDWFTYWNPEYITPEIEEARTRKRLEIEKIKLKEYERSKAELRAKTFWHRYYDISDVCAHPYVVKKKIKPYFAKQLRSYLIVPINDVNFKLKTLQIIKANGFKKFWTKTSPKGLMTCLSYPLPDDYSGYINICEGYATGCTIYEATGDPTFCSLSASNIQDVAISLRRKYINAIFKICADNDSWIDSNIGIKSAIKAAKSIGCDIYYPIFYGKYRNFKPTDFNDLLVLEGLSEVVDQLSLPRETPKRLER